MPEHESYSRFRWSVAAERMIAAPAQKVWAAISMPGNLELCHPFCASNPVQVWQGPDSRDEVHYLSGWVYERRFLRWRDGVGYDLEIGKRGGGKSFVSWRITPVDQDTCVLSITVYPNILQNWPNVRKVVRNAVLADAVQRKKVKVKVREDARLVVKYI